jgi:hypothetical protein
VRRFNYSDEITDSLAVKRKIKMLSNFPEINVDVCIPWENVEEPIVKFHLALHELMSNTDLDDPELIAWAE